MTAPFYFNLISVIEMKFSQRMGITPATKEIQLESMDNDLRNGLWNIYYLGVENSFNNYHSDQSLRNYYGKLWMHFFKSPIDHPPHPSIKEYIRGWFYSAEWFQVYDFLEYSTFLIGEANLPINISDFEDAYNKILEREFSAYRFVGHQLSRITNEQEIDSINESVNRSGNHTALAGCNLHLQSALHKLSDRNSPDYRNSIKESISAVESLAKIISGGAKDTLAASLDKIKSKLDIHPALEKGFKSIYGYTSDGDGIRHAMTEGTNADFDDAKFMLVSCSAFINYLIGKAQKAGITFN